MTFDLPPPPFRYTDLKRPFEDVLYDMVQQSGTTVGLRSNDGQVIWVATDLDQNRAKYKVQHQFSGQLGDIEVAKVVTVGSILMEVSGSFGPSINLRRSFRQIECIAGAAPCGSKNHVYAENG